MGSIFDRLGYVDPVAVSNLSANTVAQMNNMPRLLSDWQKTDMENSDTTGYYQNPVANVTQDIWDTSNTLYISTTNLTGNNILYPADNVAITLSLSNTHTILGNISTKTANSYLYLTNRLSNVIPPGTDTIIPDYNSALNMGKMMMYITNQTDNVQNNSPMIGSFTSVMISNTLNDLYSSFSNSATLLLNSISGSTSNLSLTQVLTLENTANTINNTMVKHYNDNLSFYHNSKAVLRDFSIMQKLSTNNLGETERLLINDYVGTPKLTSRINS